ncbi:hypothetical protein [Saccharothrix lopnurensis]|uniref:Uncharacterized protein n=1 Tax=Saccharothrix lopnurensis TaxID=1670621 RepID=A0ABW1P6J1_9PSEU
MVVDHDEHVIMISKHLTRWRDVGDAMLLGLRLLCQGRAIVTGPTGEPVWAELRAVGDGRPHRPPEDRPSSPRLRIVRDA